MKSLCITGNVQSNLDRVAENFGKAGAATALSASRGHEISMATWHQRVLAVYAATLEADQPLPATLGRVWEQLAGDIFLANHTQSLWYWADADSVHVLDFWLDFDPNTFFLLLHTSPQQALMGAIEQGRDTLKALQATLDDWYARTQRMLHFHLRQPERSVLINSRDILEQPDLYLDILASRWQLPLDALNSAQHWQADNQLAFYLVDSFLQRHPQVLALHSEAQSSLFLVGDAEAAVPAPELDTALDNYLEMRRLALDGQAENTALQTAIAEQKSRIETLEASAAQEKATFIAARDEQIKIADERKARLDTLTREHEQQLAQARQVLQDAESENELLLGQLHQTQEEFEQVIFKEKETIQQFQALREESTQRKQRIEALEKAATQEANEKATLITARDEQARLASECNTQINTLTREHEQQRVQASQALGEAEDENDLLLAQLHQTQEELEQYLLQYQASQAQLGEQHKRLQRVLARYPDYWSFDTLEVSQPESGSQQQSVQWRMTDLDIGGGLIPEFRFKTILTNGLAGIVIQRAGDAASPAPLLRWPAAFAGENELPCIPSQGSATQGNNAALSGLSSTDWEMLQLLIRHLAGLLETPIDSRLPEGLDTAALRNGLLALGRSLANWPKLLRYDTIQLQDTQRSEGYERLGISLSNLRFGDRHWQALDYRIATADTATELFGQNPRLEFPESSRSALQNWYAESDDERGPRLELRFAQPDAMDIPVWNELAHDDRLLIVGLISSLPAQFADLQQANFTVSRPWQDWKKLSGYLKSILTRTTNIMHQPQEA